MKVKINLRKDLPATFVAVHTTATPPHTTRWRIYDGEDVYRGDLVHWHRTPANLAWWSFTRYARNDAESRNTFTEGTFEECVAEIFKLAA
jgi:hypothetical protein